MDPSHQAASACLVDAESGRRTFPEIVRALMEAGFEAYAIDFRRGAATYYRVDGSALDLPAHRPDVPVAPTFDASGLRAAIREAQTLAPGYTYAGFRRRAAAAGCAGYLVSFLGRRVVYVGRTGETHVEHFPPGP